MSNDEKYFLRQWTIQQMKIDGEKDDETPFNTPEPVEKDHAFRFHQQDGRIVCQSVGRPGQSARKAWEDDWEATAFVYEPVHDRLLGLAVLNGKPYVLEITRWDQGNGRLGIRCGYIEYKHVPHDHKARDIWDLGYWHGDGN